MIDPSSFLLIFAPSFVAIGAILFSIATRRWSVGFVAIVISVCASGLHVLAWFLLFGEGTGDALDVFPLMIIVVALRNLILNVILMGLFLLLRRFLPAQKLTGTTP